MNSTRYSVEPKFFANANAGNANREPLRTFVEMADEFGVSEAQLRAYMKHHEAPKPQLFHRTGKSAQKSWYRPSEMRAWWKAIKQTTP